MVILSSGLVSNGVKSESRGVFCTFARGQQGRDVAETRSQRPVPAGYEQEEKWRHEAFPGQ